MKCPQCGTQYKYLGSHLQKSECEYPELTSEQHNVVAGVLMGDGSIDSHSKNPKMVISMTNKKYLNFLEDILSPHAIGVTMSKTSKESAKTSYLDTEIDPEHCSPIYSLKTICSPVFDQYASWYTDEGKRFKLDNLTPTSLLHWFVCDGTYDTSGTQNRIIISCSNESDRKEFINNLFTDIFDSDPHWSETKRTSGGVRSNIVFTREQSNNMFRFMRKSDHFYPPGFSYKFPTERFK